MLFCCDMPLPRCSRAVAARRTTCCRSLGDYLSQKIEGGDQYDLQRTAYAGLFGAAFIGTIPLLPPPEGCMHAPHAEKARWSAGPTGHLWYQFLDRAVARRFVRGSAAFVLAKVT